LPRATSSALTTAPQQPADAQLVDDELHLQRVAEEARARPQPVGVQAEKAFERAVGGQQHALGHGHQHVPHTLGSQGDGAARTARSAPEALEERQVGQPLRPSYVGLVEPPPRRASTAFVVA
jgi:hypothetical protein